MIEFVVLSGGVCLGGGACLFWVVEGVYIVQFAAAH